MSDNQEPIQAQATRSFGDYLQGVWYTLDPKDGQLMSLLGAGYFSTKGNDNLTPQRFDYRAGEVVTPANRGTRGTMAKQETVNPEDGYTPDTSNVEVPAKMTGTKRATTAEAEEGASSNTNPDTSAQAQEITDGEVGTESRSDSTRGQRSRTSSRQSGNKGNR